MGDPGLRIGQPHDCRVYYLDYKETMQHKAMVLMSRKMAAAQAPEGEFSEAGLAAIAGEDNLQMAMARNLSESIDQADMQRSWDKVKSISKKVARTGEAGAVFITAPSSPLDKLPIETQIVARSLIEGQSRTVPAEASAEFPRLREGIARIDAAFIAASAEMAIESSEDEVEYPVESDESPSSRQSVMSRAGIDDRPGEPTPAVSKIHQPVT